MTSKFTARAYELRAAALKREAWYKVEQIDLAISRMSRDKQTGICLSFMHDAARAANWFTLACHRDRFWAPMLSVGRWNSPVDCLEAPAYRNEWRHTSITDPFWSALARRDMIPRRGEWVEFYYSPLNRQVHLIGR